MKKILLQKTVRFAAFLIAVQALALAQNTVYVSINGYDSNPGTAAQPFRTLKRAIQVVQSGDTIQLGSGTFVEPATLNLSNLDGISLLGSGRGLGAGATILTGSWSNTTTDVEQSNSQPRLMVISDIEGLTIRNLTFSGNDRAIARGVDLRRIDGLTVENVDFIRFLSTALSLEDVSNGELVHMNIHESGYGWTGWSLGMVSLNSLTDVLFDFISFYSPDNPPDRSYGYAVKAVGRANDPQWNVLRRVVFSNLDIDLHPGQAWNNGTAPNFSFEFIRASLVDVEIRNSYIRNSISLPDARTVAGGTHPYGLFIHRNTFDLHGWAYWVEMAGSSIEIAYNHVKHAYPVSGHAMLIDFSRGTKTFSDISIHHNVIENAVRFMRLQSTYNNLKVYNNTVYLLLGSNPQHNAAFLAKTSSGTGSNWEINNNAVVSITGASIPLIQKTEVAPHPTNLTIRNNRLDEVTLGDIPSGATVYGNSYGDPGFHESGEAPYPYFAAISEFSPVVDAGVHMESPYVGLAPDIGAFEWGGPTVLGEIEDPGAGDGILTPDSVFASGYQSPNYPENAFDQDPHTRWASGIGSWLAADLGTAQTMNGVELTFFSGDSRSYEFQIEFSNDGNNWTPVWGTHRFSSGQTAGPETFNFSDPITARYIRYVGFGNTSNGWNSLHMFNIIGPSGEMLIFAPSSVSASSYQSPHDPENAFDHDLNTRWAAGNGSWLEADLGTSRTLTGVELVFYQGGSRSYEFRIETSTDGNHWSSVWSSHRFSGQTIGAEIFTFPSPVTARYVRYVGFGSTSNGWNSLHVFNIAGTIGEAYLFAPSFVSASSYQSPNDPENAFDHDLNTRWAAGNGSWLEADLGTSRTLTEVELVFYLGGSRSYEFRIETSTDGTNWSSVWSTHRYSGQSAGPETFTFPDPVIARYIRYVGFGSTSNGWNSLHVFNIAGTP